MKTAKSRVRRSLWLRRQVQKQAETIHQQRIVIDKLKAELAAK